MTSENWVLWIESRRMVISHSLLLFLFYRSVTSVNSVWWVEFWILLIFSSLLSLFYLFCHNPQSGFANRIQTTGNFTFSFVSVLPFYGKLQLGFANWIQKTGNFTSSSVSPLTILLISGNWVCSLNVSVIFIFFPQWNALFDTRDSAKNTYFYWSTIEFGDVFNTFHRPEQYHYRGPLDPLVHYNAISFTVFY